MTEVVTSGITWEVISDFQPIGVSRVAKITESGKFTDTFKAAADPNYGNGKWISLSTRMAAKYNTAPGPIPVVYRATAYYAGDEPAKQNQDLPENAEILGSVQVTANGQSEISASFTAMKPGFVTVVWEVKKSEQGALAELIHADWHDDYGIPAETISYRHQLEIDTALSIRTTKSGTYLVDDVFVKGLPENHSDFSGDGRFAADLPEIEQKLLFFPQGLPVTDNNISKAETIGSGTKIPARNGFYPSVGTTDFQLKQNADGTLIPGTYVFVTSFIGDNRAAPFTTSVTDPNEQYVAANTPSLHTTLTFHGKNLFQLLESKS
ncbi:hypothetical protein RQN30_07210 [Arcanobacterium hippocoleae]